MPSHEVHPYPPLSDEEFQVLKSGNSFLVELRNCHRDASIAPMRPYAWVSLRGFDDLWVTRTSYLLAGSPLANAQGSEVHQTFTEALEQVKMLLRAWDAFKRLEMPVAFGRGRDDL